VFVFTIVEHVFSKYDISGMQQVYRMQTTVSILGEQESRMYIRYTACKHVYQVYKIYKCIQQVFAIVLGEHVFSMNDFSGMHQVYRRYTLYPACKHVYKLCIIYNMN